MSAAEIIGGYLFEYFDGVDLEGCEQAALDLLDALRRERYALVELPQPLVRRGHMWPLVLGGETQFVSVPANGFSGDPIALSGVGGLTADEARYLAATLLAAAEASA